MSELKDLQGQKFHRLYVLRRIRSRNGRARWLCTCECGNQTKVLGKELRNGHIKSCGCLQRDWAKNGQKKAGTALRQLFSKTLNRAKKHGRTFELSFEEFVAMSVMPCVYCGRERASVNKYGQEEFRYNGLDRIDSSEGYTKDNTVSCCKHCNTMKSDLTLVEFFDQVERIYGVILARRFSDETTAAWPRCCK